MAALALGVPHTFALLFLRLDDRHNICFSFFLVRHSLFQPLPLVYELGKLVTRFMMHAGVRTRPTGLLGR